MNKKTSIPDQADTTLFTKARQLTLDQMKREVGTSDWGLFTEQARVRRSDERSGFFCWFESLDALLDYLPSGCVYWIESAAPHTSLQRTHRDAERLVNDFRKNHSMRDDLLFRLDNLLAPAGLELTWFGPFSELVFGHEEIPRRTRLFCRRTLADMEEPGINPLDDSPLTSPLLKTFIECLRDFGLEGHGLNGPLPTGC